MFDTKADNQLISKAMLSLEYFNGNILLTGGVPSDYLSNQIATRLYLTTNYKVDTGNIYIAGKAPFQLVAKRDITPTTLVPYKFNDWTNCVVIDSGAIIVGGYFTLYNSQTARALAQLDSNSVLNTTYSSNWGVSFSGRIDRVSLQSDGKLIVGGAFNSAQGVFTRLNSNGTPDTSFTTGTGITRSSGVVIGTVLIQSDSKIIVTGLFDYYNGTNVQNIVRVNSNGTKDTSFYTSFVPNSTITSAIQLSDGKYFIGGLFQSYQNYIGGSVISSDYLLTLASDGLVDPSFNWSGALDSSVNHIMKQSDGKVLIAGNFNSYFGVSKSKLLRLSYEFGIFVRDDSLNTGTGFNGAVRFVLQQSDGKLVVCGDFTSYNGYAKSGIVRINTDGSIDTSFDIGSGFSYTSGTMQIKNIAQQSNGKLVVVGNFSHYNGVAKENIVRINTNGSIDNLF